jgi:hypothetical protein
MRIDRTITIESNEFKLPESWSELTAAQVKYIVKQKFTAPNNQLYMTNSLIYLLGFTPQKGINVFNQNLVFNFIKGKQRYKMDAITVLSFFERLAWLNEPTSPMECPQFDKIQSPNSRLYGISLKEFLYIDRLYCDFLLTNDPKKLDPFFAKLFKGKYPYVFSSTEYYEDEEFEQTPIEEYLTSIVASLNEGKAADNEGIKNGEVHEMFYELNRKIEFSLKQKK